MRTTMLTCLAAMLALALAQAQPPPGPDLGAQREAMKKLAFLVGTWSGEASVTRGPGEPMKIAQTEDVQFKLDGLVLLIEGTGRNPNTGEIVFRALATIAYDDTAKMYRFRAYSDGRYLDTELKATDNGFEWGFQAGPATVRYVMRLTEKGEWSETGEVTIGSAPPRKTLEMLVRRQQ